MQANIIDQVHSDADESIILCFKETPAGMFETVVNWNEVVNFNCLNLVIERAIKESTLAFRRAFEKHSNTSEKVSADKIYNELLFSNSTFSQRVISILEYQGFDARIDFDNEFQPRSIIVNNDF